MSYLGKLKDGPTTMREASMLDKLRPGASHGGRVWLSFLVIGLIGAIGLALLFMMRA